MSYNRAERVGDLIKEEVATLILHGEIKDPRIGLVTITGVKMSRDLKSARVYFSMVAEAEEIEESKTGLNKASGFIRRALASKLSLKYIPSISFEYDDSLEYSSRMEKVFRELKDKED